MNWKLILQLSLFGLVMGPVFGALSGLVLGLFSFVAGKILRKKGV
jgi:uncharacterized membrane protein